MKILYQSMLGIVLPYGDAKVRDSSSANLDTLME